MPVEERPFDVPWEQRDGGVVAIATGEIDLWSAPEVRAALAPHAEGGVVLDLRGVTFMDSSGLGLIVEQQQRARARTASGSPSRSCAPRTCIASWSCRGSRGRSS